MEASSLTLERGVSNLEMKKTGTKSEMLCWNGGLHVNSLFSIYIHSRVYKERLIDADVHVYMCLCSSGYLRIFQ